MSHIKVGEVYHHRKEGVTTTQWYLFNDFSISDVEKVSFSLLFLLLVVRIPGFLTEGSPGCL